MTSADGNFRQATTMYGVHQNDTKLSAYLCYDECHETEEINVYKYKVTG